MMGKGVANFSSGVLCLKPERGPWYDARDDRCAMVLIICAFHGSGSQVGDKFFAPFAQQL